MSGAVRLGNDTLPYHAASMAVPTYDRARLTPSVVHMSVGSFHRSHQAMYFDELAQRGISHEWGLTGIGLFRRELRDVLLAQDGLYTVVARGAGGDTARVVGAMVRYLYAPESREAVLGALADARTRLVTLTVTGPGYRPGPALDLIVEALDRRRRAGLGPFTVLSC